MVDILRARALAALLRRDVASPVGPPGSLTPSESPYEAARRRIEEGVARDDDFYVSQFALNRPGTGMTGRFGLAEGLEWQVLIER